MTNDSTAVTDSAEDALRDLAPSAKLVAKTLEYEGELTQSRLTEETRLPARTVRHALKELEDCGIVTSRISFTDARKRIYSLESNAPERTIALSS